MARDGILRFGKWVAGFGPIVVFGLFVSVVLFFDVSLTVGRLLALVGTGLGAVGGSVNLVRARRTTATPFEGPLFCVIHLPMLGGIVAWNSTGVTHAGFKRMFLVGAAGMMFIGGLLVLVSLLGPDWVACLDESHVDPE